MIMLKDALSNAYQCSCFISICSRMLSDIKKPHARTSNLEYFARSLPLHRKDRTVVLLLDYRCHYSEQWPLRLKPTGRKLVLRIRMNIIRDQIYLMIGARIWILFVVRILDNII